MRTVRAFRFVMPAVVLGLFVTLTLLVAHRVAAATALDDALSSAIDVLPASGAVRTITEWSAGPGSSLLLGAVMLGIVVLLAVRRRFRALLWVAGAVIVQYIAEALLTEIVARPLPPEAGETGYSYPSGHTASATVLLTLLVAVLRTDRASWYLVVGAAVLTVMVIAISRLLASEHHATDVLGGALLGLLVATPVIPLVVGAGHLEPILVDRSEEA
jgi:undecaprenyl-diphosphatase